MSPVSRPLTSPTAPDATRRPAPGISRRNLAIGSAWALPMIAVGAAAPAQAASPGTPEACVSNRLDLDWSYGAGTFSGTALPSNPNYTSAITGWSSWTWTPYAFAGWPVPLQITASSTFSGGSFGTTASLAMRGTAGTYASGVNLGWWAGTQFAGVPINTAIGTTLKACFTFSFNIPLCGLQFAITDIDWGARESVYISSPSSGWTGNVQDFNAVTNPTSLPVAGLGTSTNPWTSKLSQTDLNNETSTRGNVLVNFTAPVSTFTICTDSRNATALKFEENVALSNLTFDCNNNGRSCP